MYKPKMIVPVLKIDQEAKEKYNRFLNINMKVERRIVYNLLSFLKYYRFNVSFVWDGEEETKVKTIKEAMELIFNLDEVRVYVKSGEFRSHYIYLVLGNGEDIISDYGFYEDDRDGFNKLMEAFKVEDYF